MVNEMTHPWFIYIKQFIYIQKEIIDKNLETQIQNSLIQEIKI